MTDAAPPFTLGVEEEYYLVDRDTGDLVPEVPEGLVAEMIGMVEPSAHRRLAVWRMLNGDGAEPVDAARGVVEMLMQESLIGIEPSAGGAG